MHEVIKHITTKPSTVKEIAGAIGLSESRVREILKGHSHVVLSTDDRPAVFSARAPQEQPPVEDPSLPKCSQCGKQAELKPAGDSEFMSNFLYCPECQATYHKYTGKPLPDAPTQKPRKLKNPQYKIEAKRKALEDAGFELRFERTDRLWHLSDQVSITADQLAAANEQELCDIAKAAGKE